MSVKERLFGSGFDFTKVKTSILAMILLREDEKLVLTRRGFFMRTRRRFVWQKAHYQAALRIVFSSFCHPIKNPLHRPTLKKVREKTVRLAYRALSSLPILEEEREVLELMIKTYEKASLFQDRLLFQAEKMAHRKQRSLVLDALAALKTGKSFLKPVHGCSGTYFAPGLTRTITGVFKPFDEEIGGPNNPKKKYFRRCFGQRLTGYSTVVGEGLFKEIAAYLIDRSLKLNVVPFTTCVLFESSFFYDNAGGHIMKKSQQKIGSFQEYRAGYYHIYEISKKNLEAIPLDQVQRIALLDLLIGNQDRNAGNLLTNGRELVAIDHGYSLSPSLLQKPLLGTFKEMPQLELPFLPLLEGKINSLSVPKLRGLLKKRCFIDERALDRLEERMALIRQAVAQGLSVKEMIELMHPRYLMPLYNRKKTLAQVAERIIFSKKAKSVYNFCPLKPEESFS